MECERKLSRYIAMLNIFTRQTANPSRRGMIHDTTSDHVHDLGKNLP